jgi:hypothetical protein
MTHNLLSTPLKRKPDTERYQHLVRPPTLKLMHIADILVPVGGAPGEGTPAALHDTVTRPQAYGKAEVANTRLPYIVTLRPEEAEALKDPVIDMQRTYVTVTEHDRLADTASDTYRDLITCGHAAYTPRTKTRPHPGADEQLINIQTPHIIPIY